MVMVDIDKNLISCTNCGLECNSDDAENSLEICIECQFNLGVLRVNEKRVS
jgi:hypothetical protein